MRRLSIKEDRYLLQLANGQGWEIIAARGATSWTGRFVSIMQLDACAPNGHPKLIFMRKRAGMADWHELPPTGWRPHDLTALQLWYHPDVPDVVCELGTSEDHEEEVIRMWLALCPVFDRALEMGGLPFHAALVTRDGKGVLLAAAGGIGKSTCCRRIPGPWKALCDDTTLVVADAHGDYRAHPFPTWSNYLWKRSEKTWDAQAHVPVSAICFLEQDTTDEAIPVGQGQASVLITESATQICQTGWRNLSFEERRAFKETLFENACALARKTPAFRLRVSEHGRFWENIEQIV
jgi:SynChlorMet cassette protein ScmC